MPLDSVADVLPHTLWRRDPRRGTCQRPPTISRLPRHGTAKNALVGLLSSGELVGYLPVLASHPDGFSIPEHDDADMVRVGRVGTEAHHVCWIDVYGGAGNDVVELHYHRRPPLGVLQLAAPHSSMTFGSYVVAYRGHAIVFEPLALLQVMLPRVLYLLTPPTEALDHGAVERWDVVRLAARHQIAVDHDLFIHPFRPGIPEIGLE